jgi:hypothetical protein
MAKNIPNSPKIHIQSGHKINQRLSLQDPPKFTQIGIFGLKIYHLATLRFWTSGPDGLAVARVYFLKLALNVRLGLGQARARFWARPAGLAFSSCTIKALATIRRQNRVTRCYYDKIPLRPPKWPKM